MQTHTYSIKKTVEKGSLPLSLLILVNIALAVAKAKGISLDESIVWQVSLAGYGVLTALINWIKNRKKIKIV